jgi:hypothetical protein
MIDISARSTLRQTTIYPSYYSSAQAASHIVPIQSCANLVGNTNDTASRARTSVTSLLGLLVSALAKVVSAGVHNDGAANNALGANQLDQLVSDAALGIALAVSLEVTQVTDVALVVLGSTVGLVVGVDCDSSASVCHSILGRV